MDPDGHLRQDLRRIDRELRTISDYLREIGPYHPQYEYLREQRRRLSAMYAQIARTIQNNQIARMHG
jgi:hypothetical protein